jgi:hypothetical protein
MTNEISERVRLIPSAAAERMRLYRERRRQGLVRQASRVFCPLRGYTTRDRRTFGYLQDDSDPLVSTAS